MGTIRIEESLSNKLEIGVLAWARLEVHPDRSAALENDIRQAEQEVRQVYSGLQPGQIDGLKVARRLYRSIGQDPTRTRPSSEALLRRVQKGGSIPRINSVVDAANLVSLSILLPIGLYDAATVDGDIHLRLGRDGEAYQRIGQGELHLQGRIALFDRLGGFGNPTGDSARTCITAQTREILFFIFAPPTVAKVAMEEYIDRAGRSLARHLGGDEMGRAFIGGDDGPLTAGIDGVR